jgi:outer membrane protein
MKASRIILIALFSFLCAGLSAQTFVGGSFRINASGNKTSDGSSTSQGPTTFGVNITPTIGRFVSEKVAIGVGLNFEYTDSKTHGSLETESVSTTTGVSPFLRYYAFKTGKFSIFGQANIGASLGSSKATVGGTTNDGPKNTNLYFNIFPGMSYDITEKISLETSLGFLSAGYNYSISKSGSDKATSSSLNVGAGTGNILNVGNLTIGAIIKF